MSLWLRNCVIASGRQRLFLRRLAQTPEHIPHHLSALARLGQGAFYAQFVVARQFDVFVFLHQANDGHGVYGRVFFEGDVDHAGRCVDLDHAVGLGLNAQAVHVDEGLALRGQLAKAVHDFFQQGVDLLAGFGRGQLFVKRQAQ